MLMISIFPLFRLCFYFSIIITIFGQPSQFHLSTDNKLCEHGGHFLQNKLSKPSSHCLVKDTCGYCVDINTLNSRSKGKPESECNILTLVIEDITFAKLMNAIHQAGDVDSPSIRKIIIQIKRPFPQKYSHAAFAKLVGNIIDKFITPRPWWKVVKEPYDWQGTAATSSSQYHNTVILERYLVEWENYWRYLVSVQYPPNALDCARMPVLVGKNSCIHPGWFSVLAFYTLTHSQFPFAVSTVYVPYLSDVAYQQNAFITITSPNKTASQVDCPTYNHSDVHGKGSDTWQCAFLAPTSCPLPLRVTACKHSSCILEQNTGFSLFLDRAAPSGQVLNATDMDSYGKAPVTEQQRNLSEHTAAPPFLFALPHNLSYARTYYNSTQRCMYSHADATSSAFIYGFLLRKSAFYRSRVAKIVHQFRAASVPHFNASFPCVAVHLRRGDRIMRVPQGVNFTEYCYNTTHGLQCDGGHCDPDAGCGENPLQPPFAAITLQHVLDKVPLLVGPGKRNVFVASDDGEWVERQIALVKAADPRWNIYTLSQPKQPAKGSGKKDGTIKDNDPYLGNDEPYAGYFYMRSHAGTASGTYLFASMELATQCEAFIGHMGCGGTMLHYQYMCMQHAGRRGICPPIYDMRNGLYL